MSRKTIKIKLKKLSENAKLPQKSKEGDFCYDVYAVDREEVMPNVFKYKLGFAYEIERNNIVIENYNHKSCSGGIDFDMELSPANICINFLPRSSVYKTGLVLCNSMGVLDEFYRGEAMAFFYHVIPELPIYEVGDRIGQIKIGFTYPCEFVWDDNINLKTERGDGGFGSSGNKELNNNID